MERKREPSQVTRDDQGRVDENIPILFKWKTYITLKWFLKYKDF